MAGISDTDEKALALVMALGDPNQAVFFGAMGIAAAVVFANLGSAYGTAKSGVGIVSVAVLKPDLLFKSIIPVVMAGVLGMYGMIIAILMNQQVSKVSYDSKTLSQPENWGYGYYNAYKQLGAGLCCGLSNLAAGLCIGVVGDAAVRGNAQRDILIALILMMIFAEALALYGFIVAIVVSQG
uniref:V-type proton ATPase proteolipid subunit n=2 Tax=Choreotrichia TaxID=141411 RepID=A0A7S3I199_9SPIT|mmetsp:Transcript_27507/g.34181  ORF Transcript_27507/g.34181 Transcript_27507/m.34181 type:complete len:182 (+) Transcript_27507:66-611(+)|eukprot:CAMPEP_0170461858 /NCGR_PEP_ID=MMETSP0123-20130129/7596_1 /TAXON_ID=182087 /ORGANISM="Favella ehrenbergii, Strain Fehren 1" /LENGTH=181 /DNA_ID=CAMNT_0010726963 /DNA_START=59 /DNA_END=604 /DNA_ORIENTATION=-